MTRTLRLSPLLLAVALSPAMLQQVSCESTGNATLASLEIEAAGLPRVVGFSGSVTAYDVWTTGGVDTILVSASTVVPGARVNYRLTTGGVLTTGSLGIGGGQATLSIVPDSISNLQVDVSDGSTRKLYVIDLNPLCSGGECTDNNSCTADACIGSTCSFSTEPDGSACDFAGVGDGECNAGLCEEATPLVLEQASKQAGVGLQCSISQPGTDLAVSAGPVIESDGNNNINLSGTIVVSAVCSFSDVDLTAAEVLVSVNGATPVALSGVVAGLPQRVPDDFNQPGVCTGFFDIVAPIPPTLSVSDPSVDFTVTDIILSVSGLGIGTTTVSASDPRCNLVPAPPLPSSVSFSAQPAGPCDLDPCNDDNSCTVDACTVDPGDGSRICTNTNVADGTACDELLPAAATCSSGLCSITKPVPVACTDNDLFLPDGWGFSYFLTATPLGPVEDGVPVDFELSGTASISADFFTYTLGTFPTLTEIDLTAAQATVAVRSGATGPNVALAFDGTLPAILPLPPVINDPNTCFPFQFCVQENLTFPLAPQVATYTPTGGPGGEILFGWDESTFPPTAATYDGDPTSIGSEIEFETVQTAFECQMGRAIVEDPFNDPLNYTLIPLEDSFLLSVPISTGGAICGNGIIEGPEECDDGNIFNEDGCADDCTVDPIIEVVPVACSNDQNNSIIQHDMRLIVDPLGPIEGGSPFGVELRGEVVILEFWLDAVQSVVAGGAPEIVVDHLRYEAIARSGATGPSVVLGRSQPYAEGFCISPTGLESCTTDADCGSFACGEVFQVPRSTSFATCDALGKGTQWATNGFCVTNDLRILTEPKTGTFVADSSGSVLFGWKEGTPPIPPINPTQRWRWYVPIEVESECYMGTENASQTALVPLPDADLISLPILP